MKTVSIILLLLMVSFLSKSQAKYGIGVIVIENFSKNNSLSRVIFFSKVVNLDSLSCNSSALAVNADQDQLYFHCINKWLTDKIIKEFPNLLNTTSKVYFLSEVELEPDFFATSNDDLSRLFNTLNNKRDSQRRHLEFAEKKRLEMIVSADSSEESQIVLLN